MNAKCTPGPWGVEIDNKTSSPIVVSRKTGACVAWPAGPFDDERLANAGLIASVYELLDAAKEALEYLESWKDLSGGRAYRMLDTAITKATGAAS